MPGGCYLSLMPLREKYVNPLTDFDTSFQEGREEGRAEGIEQGKLATSVNIARQLLATGMPVDQIAKITGLAPPEIEALKH